MVRLNRYMYEYGINGHGLFVDPLVVEGNKERLLHLIKIDVYQELLDSYPYQSSSLDYTHQYHELKPLKGGYGEGVGFELQCFALAVKKANILFMLTLL